MATRWMCLRRWRGEGDERELGEPGNYWAGETTGAASDPNGMEICQPLFDGLGFGGLGFTSSVPRQFGAPQRQA
jgi:hypothetical protein